MNDKDFGIVEMQTIFEDNAKYFEDNESAEIVGIMQMQKFLGIMRVLTFLGIM
uniref:Uncharacterized protein n=1 Tax=Arion vulgaris TaxID=1028688 RepID=A0A0B6ZW04_9EUPU